MTSLREALEAKVRDWCNECQFPQDFNSHTAVRAAVGEAMWESLGQGSKESDVIDNLVGHLLQTAHQGLAQYQPDPDKQRDEQMEHDND